MAFGGPIEIRLQGHLRFDVPVVVKPFALRVGANGVLDCASCASVSRGTGIHKVQDEDVRCQAFDCRHPSVGIGATV